MWDPLAEKEVAVWFEFRVASMAALKTKPIANFGKGKLFCIGR